MAIMTVQVFVWKTEKVLTRQIDTAQIKGISRTFKKKENGEIIELTNVRFLSGEVITLVGNYVSGDVTLFSSEQKEKDKRGVIRRVINRLWRGAIGCLR